MNVLLIISDSLRADYLGCYGNTWVRTPCIDALAAQGTRFENAFVGSFPTGPMRKDVHCGRFTFPYASWDGDFLPGEALLGERMHDAGYTTALIGDLFCLRYYRRGFDHYEFIPGQDGNRYGSDKDAPVPLPAPIEKLRAPEGRLQAIMRTWKGIRNSEETFVAQSMRAAARWLENQYDLGRDRAPFFLMVDTFDPHEPWIAPKHFRDLYDPDYAGNELIEPNYSTSEYATPEEIRHMRCLYAAEVSLVDHWVGYLIDSLERLRMADDTVVIFTSDHGFYHGEHGYIGKVQLSHPEGKIIGRWPLFRTISHIPLIIRGAEAPKGAARNYFCQPPDFMPTILDYAGAQIPPSVQGFSLRRAVSGAGDTGRNAALSTCTYVTDDVVRCPSVYRTKEWTYVYGGDESQSGLYDLRRDPEETRNLIDENESQARALHDEYLQFVTAIDTPSEKIEGRREFRPVRRSYPEASTRI